jgi:hypothetical protein
LHRSPSLYTQTETQFLPHYNDNQIDAYDLFANDAADVDVVAAAVVLIPIVR